MHAHIRSHDIYSAYDLIAHLTKASDAPVKQITTHKHVNDHAPDNINAYPDGSLIHGNLACFGLSTAAVWWPGRALNHILDATTGETDFGFVFANASRAALYNKLMGTSTSSARAEVFGLIMSLLAPTPVHAGIDNASVVNRCNSLIKRITPVQNRKI